MSQEENAAIQAAVKESEEAKRQAEQAAARFKSIEESQRRQLPLTPEQTLGRTSEQVKQQKIKPEKLERKEATGQIAGIREFVRGGPKKIAPETGKPQTLRDVIRRRYGGGHKQSARVRTSRGTQVYSRGKVVDSSGRISTELNPQKAERLASLREKVRAFQNRKELVKLEQIWRRTRAARPHDPELRP